MTSVDLPVAPNEPPAGPRLYRWQHEALVRWLECGRRGVVEAVTGSGKTDVAIAAIADAVRRGRFVLVLVPSRVLLEQWHGRLSAALDGARIGRLGDNGRDDATSCDVLVSTRHSAATHRPVPPEGTGGLIVVDECHGLGGGVLRRALLPQYDERLGLTATLERSDDAVTDLLVPYFGGVCHRYGFGEAIADGVCAAPSVAFVGVPLRAEERAEYAQTEQQLVEARRHLRSVRHMPLEPFGAFLAAVAHLAERDVGPDGRAARDYLDAFAKRRQIVAESTGKYELLGRFAPLIREADGALLFTETVRAANHAVFRLDPHLSIELITGSTARGQRREILDDLRVRRLDAVAAPRVLDEGVDVPDANLGIVMSASRTRRQMIQRMGRILRRKRPGVGARFVIMFAADTIEDPAMRIERDGFLDEIERIAHRLRVFDESRFVELEEFLRAPGPTEVPSPTRAPGAPALAGDLDTALGALADDLGPAEAYSRVAFVADPVDPDVHAAAQRVLVPRLPAPPADVPAAQAGEAPEGAPYLELERLQLPEIDRPKVEPRKLSTGQAPLEISAVDDGWQMSCTGCGETSAKVRFRWQVLEQTVDCRCA